MQQVKTGDTVKVHYKGRLTNGDTFDSSEGSEPLEFEVGGGLVIKGFDEGVMGMAVGEKKTVNIPVEQAYGPRDQERIIEIPKSQFPADLELEIGMPLSLSDGSGQNFRVIVTEIKDDSVVLDENHPLAGEDLVFDLELVEIVPPKSRIIMP